MNFASISETSGLFDPETATEEERLIMEKQRLANEKANEGMSEAIKKLEMRLALELRDVAGEYHDEVSLLNQVSSVNF